MAEEKGERGSALSPKGVTQGKGMSRLHSDCTIPRSEKQPRVFEEEKNRTAPRDFEGKFVCRVVYYEVIIIKNTAGGWDRCGRGRV